MNLNPEDPVAAATNDENEDQFVDITASTKFTLDSRLLQVPFSVSRFVEDEIHMSLDSRYV